MIYDICNKIYLTLIYKYINNVFESVHICNIYIHNIQLMLTATYSGAATLPLLLEGKCDESTCTTLTTNLNTVTTDLREVHISEGGRRKRVVARSLLNM